jgi:DNA gyrase inhibitor GyrI
MRVASVHGFGASPEGVAWQKLVAWAKPRGLVDDLSQRRIFGFNNPNPSPGSPNYGYEFWITVGPEVEAGGEATIKDFGGGLYAVTRCTGVQTIEETWKRFVKWMEEKSSYTLGRHQWLEEHLGGIDVDPEHLEMDLYMPIKV